MEREKANLQQDLMSSKAISDKLNVEKSLLDREVKSINQKYQDAQLRLDEASRNLSDLEAMRNKLTGQNHDLERKLGMKLILRPQTKITPIKTVLENNIFLKN